MTTCEQDRTGAAIDLLGTAAQLCNGGYSPFLTVDKRCAFWGWPTFQPTAEALSRASRAKQFILDENGPESRFNGRLGARENGWRCRPQAVALRLDNALAVIDFDVDHPIIDIVADRVLKAVPALRDAPVRFGGGCKEGWFCRAGPDADFFRIPNTLWCAAGSDPLADTVKTHQVEIFGGGGRVTLADGSCKKPKKYFAAFGAHTFDPSTGSIERAYAWAEDYSPANTPLKRLPELSMADFRTISDTADAVFVEHGWHAMPRRGGGGSLSGRMTPIYDLVEGMDIDGYRLSDLYQMAERGQIGPGIRIQISPVPWLRKSSKSGASCCITVTAKGVPCVVDWQENALHLPVTLARTEIDSLIAEKLRKLSQGKPSLLDIISQEWQRRDAIRAGRRK